MTDTPTNTPITKSNATTVRRTSRRGNQEGSITQLSDGRWQARLSLDNGKRKAFYGKTRQEGEWLR